MNTSIEDYFAKPYGLKIRPYSDYHEGQKIVFTIDTNFAVIVPAGTLAIVTKVFSETSIMVKLLFSPDSYKKEVVQLFEGEKEISHFKVDIIQEREDNAYINLGDWIPARKSMNGEGWHIPSSSRYFLALKLKDGAILEGNLEGWSSTSGYCTELKINSHSIASKEIENIAYKKLYEPLKVENKEMADKFEQGIKANGENEFEQACNCFKECYENNYKAAECAGFLGLIAINHYEDVEEAKAKFNAAIHHGSKEPFVYLYLIEIYAGKGKTYPKEYYQIAHSRNTELSLSIIQKIRTMCGQSPSDFNKYNFD